MAAKPKWIKCGSALSSNSLPVRCDQCDGLFYVVYSVNTANNNRANFRCALCEKGNTSRPVTQLQIYPDGPKLSQSPIAELYGH